MEVSESRRRDGTEWECGGEGSSRTSWRGKRKFLMSSELGISRKSLMGLTKDCAEIKSADTECARVALYEKHIQSARTGFFETTSMLISWRSTLHLSLGDHELYQAQPGPSSRTQLLSYTQLQKRLSQKKGGPSPKRLNQKAGDKVTGLVIRHGRILLKQAPPQR